MFRDGNIDVLAKELRRCLLGASLSDEVTAKTDK
jgi:hypothetical protein